MRHRWILTFLCLWCLTSGLGSALLAQKAPIKGAPASLNDLQLGEPPWSGSDFVQRLQGHVAFFAVLLAPGQVPVVQGAPAGMVNGSLAAAAQRDAPAFAKRFNRWMHKEASSASRNSAMCAALMARPPGVSMAPPPRVEADVALQRYLQDLGYHGPVLLAAGAFEAAGGLTPGHYLVFDAKGALLYNGSQESKAEQIMRTALREAEQEARKARR